MARFSRPSDAWHRPRFQWLLAGRVGMDGRCGCGSASIRGRSCSFFDAPDAGMVAAPVNLARG